MRCKNCGWENPDGNLRCEKCNAPLSGSMVNSEARRSASMPDEPSVLKGTIPEGQIFSSNAVNPAENNNVCTKCGYPIARGMSECPNCGASSDQPSNFQNKRKNSYPGTVNPWDKPKEGTFCTLKPIAWSGEGIEHSPISYSGERIVLTRENTDPNNQSITSKAQAELSCENGAWFIEDKSEQRTTFIHAGRKTRLEAGDIIIMGNRRFVFKG